MKKLLSLVKVSLNHDMNIFKINKKKQGKYSKIILPLCLIAYFMYIIAMYASLMMKNLMTTHLEYTILTIFALGVSMLCLMEGIYKSGTLLFNCKDDNLLMSMPISKRTILFIRMFKFYVFELLYNSLFILPVMLVYAYYMSPEVEYYLVSFVSLLLLPIIPIIISCIIGFIITYLSSHFKGKNIIQTILTIVFIFIFMYFMFRSEMLVSNFISNALSINNYIVKLYYPVGTYILLVNNFDVMTLITYILIHILIIIITLFVLSKIYFKVNSNSKKVIIDNKNKNYIIKTNSKAKAFIKKELNRFFSTPVFITNAGFGLVLFIIGCILFSLKFDMIVTSILEMNSSMTVEKITNQLPVLIFGLVCFGSLMTSITSSMISLEGGKINLLKALPIKPINIILYKVLTSLIIIIPCILIGNIILFIRFNLSFINILLILIATILIPTVTELIGIIINLKYPKIDASNDTEVVKQSMSSFLSTIIGMGLLGITICSLFILLDTGLNNNVIILLFLVIYLIIAFILIYILNKKCDKWFNNIT